MSLDGRSPLESRPPKMYALSPMTVMVWYDLANASLKIWSAVRLIHVKGSGSWPKRTHPRGEIASKWLSKVV